MREVLNLLFNNKWFKGFIIFTSFNLLFTSIYICYINYNSISMQNDDKLDLHDVYIILSPLFLFLQVAFCIFISIMYRLAYTKKPSYFTLLFIYSIVFIFVRSLVFLLFSSVGVI